MKTDFNKIISVLAISALPAFAMADNAFSGFQVGAALGYEDVSMDWETDHYISAFDQSRGNPSGDTSESLDDSAFAYGVFANYNMALNGNWIIGAELGYQGSSISDSVNRIPGSNPFTGPSPNRTKAEVDVNDTFLIGIKGGYLLNESTMAYSTLSATFTEVEVSSNCASDNILCDGSAPAHSSSDDDSMTGWALALGVEKSLSDNISVRAEYRYADLGTAELAAVQYKNSAAIGVETDIDVTSQTLQIGAAYKF